MKRYNRTNLIIFLGILLGAITIVCLPLFHPNFFVSDDGGWLIIRLTAFYQSFREGQFPVRFLGRLNYGYGYPVANFNYPGFMYIGSLIHFFGVSFVDTVKVILGGSVLVGTIFTFLWLKKYFSDIASFIGALGFTFAPYLLFDIYRRGSVGEVLAFAWAAMGIYSIKADKRWLFGLAVPLLILAHNTQGLLFLGFFAAYITLLGAWKKFFFMFAAGIGMGAFFWMPALYERKYIMFDTVTVADPKTFFIAAGSMNLLGASGILAGVVALLTNKILQKEKIFFIICLTLTILCVFPVSTPLWDIPLVARIIQFPFRLLALTIPVGAWLTAYAVQTNKKLMRLLLIIIFICIGLWSAWRGTRVIGYVKQPDGFYSTNESTSTIADEYMPKWVIRKPTTHAPEKLLFYKGRGAIRTHQMTSQTIDVVVSAAEDSIVQINTLYYPGWGATVDGTKAHIDYSNNEGVMRIAIPAGDHRMVVAFRETISRFLADCLSLVSLVVYVGIVVLRKNQKSRKK